MMWYNEPLKIEFVNHYQGIVAKNAFMALFNRSCSMETWLQKDCCEFNIDEITDLLRSYRSSDVSAVIVKNSLLKSYTQFCLERGFVSSGINHYAEITSDACRNLIDKRKAAATYLTEKEVDEIVDAFENPRDKYLILAPYEGIYGEGLCELIELKEDDLLGNQKVHLCTNRVITVSRKLYTIMCDAAVTEIAIYGNREKELESCPYVYKNTKGTNTGRITQLSIIRRYFSLRNVLERDTFGIKMLYNSGFLNSVSKAVQEYGDFGQAEEEILKIQEQYQNKYSISKIKRLYKEMLEMTGRDA